MLSNCLNLLKFEWICLGQPEDPRPRGITTNLESWVCAVLQVEAAFELAVEGAHPAREALLQIFQRRAPQPGELFSLSAHGDILPYKLGSLA